MAWMVPFIDYPAQFRKIESAAMQVIHEVLSQGDLILRRQLQNFEARFAGFVGTKHAVGTSTCTDALHLSLRAAGIGPGDEVITVAHTFVATVAAIHHAGAKPILVDVGADHNMDMSCLESAISPRTRAIIPVHLNGRLCDMERLTHIAARHSLILIEDSAQALGASFQGKKGGAWGLAGCFSFYPAKLLGAYGDAGAIVTDDANLARRIRLLRDHGRTPDADIAGWSFNCRMDNLQAALLDLKLDCVPVWIERRRELARLYHEQLSGLLEVRLPPCPETAGDYFDTYQNFEIEARDRDALASWLKGRGIEILIPWGGRAVHQFRALGLSGAQLTTTEAIFPKLLLLPLHTELTDEQIAYVSTAVREFYRHAI
jgi:dTDP-4-amino-4,6-dideoxygalactose transaminase